MIRLFLKKATQQQVDGIDTRLTAECDKLYQACASQKKMLDILLDYLKLEPVTTTTIRGTSYPEKTTILQVKKKSKPVKEDYNDDD